jgi:hypothetical protein
MRRLFQLGSWIALAGTILPSVMFLFGHMNLEQSKLWLLVATVLWFAATPLWMGQQDDRKSTHEVTDCH